MKIFYNNTIILLLSFIATAQVAHAQEQPEVSTAAGISHNHTQHCHPTYGFCGMSPTLLSGKESCFPHSRLLITSTEDCRIADRDRHTGVKYDLRQHRTQQQMSYVAQQATVCNPYGYPAKMYPNKTI